jgi:hypothetical protein
MILVRLSSQHPANLLASAISIYSKTVGPSSGESSEVVGRYPGKGAR